MPRSGNESGPDTSASTDSDSADMSLKERLSQDVKDAMRARDKGRVATLRMTLAAIKQREIDERIELDDNQTLSVIEKMIKQRHESARMYREGQRPELAEAEEAEVLLLQSYLPERLSEADLDALIEQVIEATGASSMKDMGSVMGRIKGEAQGRADMADVSAKVKARLAG